MVVIKKYGNRRLYDTQGSCYVTLDNVAEAICADCEIQVVDARTGKDLTQATLAQIILESRGAAKLLPVPLLKQLIRMGDDALGEFFGRYMAWALDVYVEARRGAQQTLTWNPLTAAFLGPGSAFSRLFMGGMPWGGESPKASSPPFASPPPPFASPPPPFASPPADPHEGAPDAPDADEIAELRREIAALKRIVGHGRRLRSQSRR